MWQATTLNIEVRETIAQHSGQLTDQHRTERDQFRGPQRACIERLGDTHPLTIIGQDRDLQSQLRQLSLTQIAPSKQVKQGWLVEKFGHMPTDPEPREICITAANDENLTRGMAHAELTGSGRLTPRIQMLVRDYQRRLALTERRVEQDLGPEL